MKEQRGDDNKSLRKKNDNDNHNNESVNANSLTIPWTTRGVIICSFLWTFLYVGGFFGWGYLQLMLEDAGAFAGRCQNETANVCPEQAAALVNLPFYAQLIEIASPLLGHLSDLYGPLTTFYIMTTSIWTGLSLILVGVQGQHLNFLLYPGFVLFGLAVTLGGLLLVPIGLIVDDRRMTSRIIFFLNSLYDAGATTFLILYGVQQATGVSIVAILSGYLGIALVLNAVFGYLWTIVVAEKKIEEEMRQCESTERNSSRTLHTSMSSSQTTAAHSLGTIVDVTDSEDIAEVGYAGRDNENNKYHNDDDLEPTVREVDFGIDVYDNESDGRFQGGNDDEEQGDVDSDLIENEDVNKEDTMSVPPASQSQRPRQMVTGDKNKNKNENHSNSKNENDDENHNRSKKENDAQEDEYVLVMNRTPRQQLTSQAFLLCVAYYSMHVSMNRWIMVTTREHLAFLGDDEKGNRYLLIFTLIGPCSILLVPLMDSIAHSVGYPTAFQIVNFLAVGQFLFRMLSDDLNVQIVAFVCFAVYRSLFYGLVYGWLPTLLAPNVVGKASGLLIGLGGIIGYACIPLSDYAIQNRGGDFFVSDLVQASLIIPSVVIVCFLRRVVAREERTKERLEERLKFGVGET